MRGETIALRRSHECHDRHRRLLRPGSERPRSRRTAEKRDEFAPFHYPMPPVLPTERIAHSVVQETYCAARFGEGLWQLRVKMRRTRVEHMSAGLHPIADIARRDWHGREVPQAVMPLPPGGAVDVA